MLAGMLQSIRRVDASKPRTQRKGLATCASAADRARWAIEQGGGVKCSRGPRSYNRCGNILQEQTLGHAPSRLHLIGIDMHP